MKKRVELNGGLVWSHSSCLSCGPQYEVTKWFKTGPVTDRTPSVTLYLIDIDMIYIYIQNRVLSVPASAKGRIFAIHYIYHLENKSFTVP